MKKVFFFIFIVYILGASEFQRFSFFGRRVGTFKIPAGKVKTVKGTTYLIKNGQSFKVNVISLKKGERGFMFETTIKGTLSLYVYHLNGALFINGKKFKGQGWLSIPHKGGKLNIKIKGKGNAVLSDIFINDSIREYIFLISADTLRWDFVNEKITPNIVKFSKDSAVFTKTYSPSSWTLPAHMSVFTSKYPFEHGAYCRNDSLPDFESSLVEILSKYFFTYSLNGGMFVGISHGFFRGFDIFTEYDNDLFNKFASEKLFKKAIESIKQMPVKRAFFFLHTYQIHSPYQCPGWGCKKGEKRTWMRFPEFLGGLNNMFMPVPEELRQNALQLYSDEVSYFDEWFGWFIDELKKMGIYRNSMIVLFSDHGEEFYDHEGWGHGHTLFNELIKVPLIVKYPYERVKSTINNSKSLIDIFPTIFKEYKIKPGVKLYGNPLDEHFQNEIYSTLLCPNIGRIPYQAAIIRGNRKLIVMHGGNFKDLKYRSGFLKDGAFLFDLSRDPFECHPLKTEPALKRRALELIRKFKRRGRAGEIEKLKALGYI